MTCDGEYAGECVRHSVGHYSHALEAQHTLFTTWPGVADERQGSGWGKYLLTEALRAGCRVGYRDAVISTDPQNHRALPLDTNVGYRVTHTAASFRAGA